LLDQHLRLANAPGDRLPVRFIHITLSGLDFSRSLSPRAANPPLRAVNPGRYLELNLRPTLTAMTAHHVFGAGHAAVARRLAVKRQGDRIEHSGLSGTRGPGDGKQAGASQRLGLEIHVVPS